MTDSSVTPRLPDGWTLVTHNYGNAFIGIKNGDLHGGFYEPEPGAVVRDHAFWAFLSAFLSPQPEATPADKPETLVEETFGKTFRDRFFMNKPINHPDHPNNCTDPTWSHFYWLLRELDRRLP